MGKGGDVYVDYEILCLYVPSTPSYRTKWTFLFYAPTWTLWTSLRLSVERLYCNPCANSILNPIWNSDSPVEPSTSALLPTPLILLLLLFIHYLKLYSSSPSKKKKKRKKGWHTHTNTKGTLALSLSLHTHTEWTSQRAESNMRLCG